MKDLNKQQEDKKKLADAQTKAQLEDLKNRNNPPQQPEQSGDGQQSKTMGPPSPPSKDKQQKRLEQGVNTDKGGSKPNASRGNTRKPKDVQESEAMALTNDTRYRAIKLANNERGLATSFFNPFTSKDVAIIRVPLHDGIAGFSEDETKIYIDSEVPDWMILGLIAHESFEKMLIDLGFSYDWSHIQATQVERMLCKDLGIDYEKYDDEYHRLLNVVENRKPRPDDPEDMYQGYAHSHKNHKLSRKLKKKKVEESQKLEITVKAEPLKTDITLKEDPEKKKGEDEIREKKKKLLDKMEQKIEGEN
jgi:hypothetical protein